MSGLGAEFSMALGKKVLHLACLGMFVGNVWWVVYPSRAT